MERTKPPTPKQEPETKPPKHPVDIWLEEAKDWLADYEMVVDRLVMRSHRNKIVWMMRLLVKADDLIFNFPSKDLIGIGSESVKLVTIEKTLERFFYEPQLPNIPYLEPFTIEFRKFRRHVSNLWMTIRHKERAKRLAEEEAKTSSPSDQPHITKFQRKNSGYHSEGRMFGVSATPQSQSISKPIEHYLPIAKKLSTIIQNKCQVLHTKIKILMWCKDIRMLVERDGVSDERINVALDWYAKRIGEEFVPWIESGKALRDKFLRLEHHMKTKPIRKLNA